MESANGMWMQQVTNNHCFGKKRSHENTHDVEDATSSSKKKCARSAECPRQRLLRKRRYQERSRRASTDQIPDIPVEQVNEIACGISEMDVNHSQLNPSEVISGPGAGRILRQRKFAPQIVDLSYEASSDSSGETMLYHYSSSEELEEDEDGILTFMTPGARLAMEKERMDIDEDL